VIVLITYSVIDGLQFSSLHELASGRPSLRWKVELKPDMLPRSFVVALPESLKTFDAQGPLEPDFEENKFRFWWVRDGEFWFVGQDRPTLQGAVRDGKFAIVGLGFAMVAPQPEGCRLGPPPKDSGGIPKTAWERLVGNDDPFGELG
jgi:hypothetical protein